MEKEKEKEKEKAISLDSTPCEHKWRESGFIGPYWVYTCRLCGKDDFRP